MNKIINYFSQISKGNTGYIVLLIGVFIFSSLLLFIPIHYLILAFFTLIILCIYFYKPELALYSFVLCIPLIRPNFHYIHFQDIFISICLVSLLLNIGIRRYSFVNISTKVDIWLFAVMLLFIIKGFGSIEMARGSLHAIRFIEAVTLFYMLVYFIRAKKVKITFLIKLLIFTAAIQGLIGPIQTLFNDFGVQEYASNRGYFGYLGLGPTLVYPGRGTFWHFAAYGYFLGTILLFLLPFYRNIFKKKNLIHIVFLILLAGLIFSYSRGALGALLIGIGCYLFIIEARKREILLKLLLLLLITAPFAFFFLTNQEYMLSLNPRNPLWDFHITYLSQNINEFIWGAGFESRELTFYSYAPKFLRHPGDFNPHNLVLTYIEEIGITGFVIFLSFWIKVFIDSIKNLKSNSKLMKTFNFGFLLVLINVVLSGINDHVYHDPYLTMFLMFLLGIIYAKNEISTKKSFS